MKKRLTTRHLERNIQTSKLFTMSEKMISNKHTRILEEICFKYLPDVFPTKKSRETALAHPKIFNIEHMVELALAKLGGYNFIDDDGRDFDDIDNSDAKTCTVRERDRGLTIGKTENKIGSFRIVVYNEITEKLDYIYLTNKGRQLHTEREFLKKRPDEQRIRATYNHHFDHYNKLEDFRVENFETLAKMTDSLMEKKNPRLARIVARDNQTGIFGCFFESV